MNSVRDRNPNPFRSVEAKPEWAQLIRLAGDRAAILFQELRRRLGRIEGLHEELHYDGPERGWAPRYRVGEYTLFTAHILAGRLEATVELEGPLKEELLNSPKMGARLKEAIRDAAGDGGVTTVRVGLSNQATLRSFTQLIRIKSNFRSTLPRE